MPYYGTPGSIPAVHTLLIPSHYLFTSNIYPNNYAQLPQQPQQQTLLLPGQTRLTAADMGLYNTHVTAANNGRADVVLNAFGVKTKPPEDPAPLSHSDLGCHLPVAHHDHTSVLIKINMQSTVPNSLCAHKSSRNDWKRCTRNLKHSGRRYCQCGFVCYRSSKNGFRWKYIGRAKGKRETMVRTIRTTMSSNCLLIKTIRRCVYSMKTNILSYCLREHQAKLAFGGTLKCRLTVTRRTMLFN